MKTDALIAQLTAEMQSAPPRRAWHRWAVVAATVLFSLWLLRTYWGMAPNLHQLTQVPAFWFKLLLLVCACVTASSVMWRLSQPGRPTKPLVWQLCMILSALVVMACSPFVFDIDTPRVDSTRWALAGVNPLHSGQGSAWRTLWWAGSGLCALAMPMLLALVWMLRDMAATRPAWAGASAGFVASALSAVLFSLHATDPSSPFATLGYLVGMALMPLIGAVLGRWLLRW